MTKIEQKFHVAANSKISDIFGKLNSVQKQTVSLFDTDRNGILDAKEAKAFNLTIFSEKDDRIDCWLQLKSGKKTKTTVMKKDIDTTALNLEKIEVGTKNIDNKKVHYIQSKLNKIQAGSNKKIVEKRFTENSDGYEYESQDKDGNVKYSRDVWCNNGTKKRKEYVILNNFGEVIEKSEAEYCTFNGHIVARGNNKKYYDDNNKLIASEEELKNGRIAYKNAKGEVLYQAISDVASTVYFDKNGTKLYEVTIIPADGLSRVEIYNNKGNIVKTVKDFDYDPSQLYLDYSLDKFKEINKNPIDKGGKLCVFKN